MPDDRGIRAFFGGKLVLVTGSNGFVGRNLIEKLLLLGTSIVGVGTKDESLTHGIKYEKLDLTGEGNISKLLKQYRPDVIFHLAAVVTAARDYSLYSAMMKLHVGVLMDFYQELSSTQWKGLFVNFGSAEEYGDYHGIPCREDFFEKSTSPYAVSKTAGTHLAYMLGKNESFPVITVRPGVLYGKYQSPEKFPSYVEQKLKKGEPLFLTGGEQTRDFMGVDDFISELLNLIACRNYVYGEIYNIASGTSITLKEYVDKRKAEIGSRSVIRYGELPYRKNEIMEFSISIEKTNGLFRQS